VDDVPANLLALEAVLEPLGQPLVRASSGEEALRQLMQGDFAVILMDVQMPGLSGLDTAVLIRQRERTRHIPLLFITALSREAAHVMRGYASGAVDYLLKPVDPDILRAKVAVFVDLYQHRELLKQQAAELAEERRAAAELRRASELEQQLVGVVSHDLRTPLASIHAGAQLLLRQEGLSEGAQRTTRRILASSHRMERLVADLLDFTRARLGGGIPVHFEPVDICELVRLGVEEARAAHGGREVELELPRDGCTGEWDGARLSQVLTNLLDNALKYSPPGSPVRVSLRTGRGGAALLEVHNGGDPIPGEVMGRLFEPFERGAREDDVQGPKGLGLGLYISRDIVRAHGGTLLVDSSAGAGTTFRVCLPPSRGQGLAPDATLCAAGGMEGAGAP
jgi:signal transduction histidine kinase